MIWRRDITLPASARIRRPLSRLPPLTKGAANEVSGGFAHGGSSALEAGGAKRGRQGTTSPSRPLQIAAALPRGHRLVELALLGAREVNEMLNDFGAERAVK